MNRHQIVLAGLAPANETWYSPVQVQKLFFLLDQNISKSIGGPFFDFQPYNYGPFDKMVYETLEELAMQGLVQIDNGDRRQYQLTRQGLEEGKKILNGFPDKEKRYVVEVSEFVRKLTFAQLVSAIYKAYPEMKANSVFED
ncbi:MAG: hypothetical protein HYZ22_14035 [Chloroflexi bacterium]|nr:hypothetical protein [Chloroflexota bacterium]